MSPIPVCVNVTPGAVKRLLIADLVDERHALTVHNPCSDQRGRTTATTKVASNALPAGAVVDAQRRSDLMRAARPVQHDLAGGLRDTVGHTAQVVDDVHADRDRRGLERGVDARGCDAERDELRRGRVARAGLGHRRREARLQRDRPCSCVRVLPEMSTRTADAFH